MSALVGLNIAGAGLGTVFAATNAAEGDAQDAIGWSLVAGGNVACVGSHFMGGWQGAALAGVGMLGAIAGIGLAFASPD